MKVHVLPTAVLGIFVVAGIPALGQCSLSAADGHSLDAAYRVVTGKSLREGVDLEPDSSSLECVSVSSIVAAHVPGSRFVLILDRRRAFSRWEMSDAGPNGSWERALQRYLAHYLQTSPETLWEVFGRTPFHETERKDLEEAINAKVLRVAPLRLESFWFDSLEFGISTQKRAVLSRLVLDSVCKYFEIRWPDHWVQRLEIDPIPSFDSVIHVRILARSPGRNVETEELVVRVGVAFNPRMAPFVGKVYPIE